MELIACKSCSENISPKAVHCPKCGHPNEISKRASRGAMLTICAVIGVVVFGFAALAIMGISSSSEDRGQQQQGALASCSKAKAAEVRDVLATMSKTTTAGAALVVTWSLEIEKGPASKQLEMVTAYADMDACLNGSARPIAFMRNGKLMAMASPSTGIKLTD